MAFPSASTSQATDPVLLKLRHKFVITNMVFVLAVLVVAFGVISGITYNQRVGEVNDALNARIKMAVGIRVMNEGLSIDQLTSGPFGTAGRIEAQPPDDEASTAFGDKDRPDNGTSNVFDDADRPDDAPQDPATSKAQPGDRAGERRNLGPDQMLATSTYVLDENDQVDQVISDALNLDSETLESAVAGVREQSQSLAAGKISHGKIKSHNLYYQVKQLSEGSIVAFASGSYIDRNMLSLVKTLVLVGLVSAAVFFAISLFLSRWALRPVERTWEQQRQFVADASHELKTPLSVIMANDSILMSQPDATIGSQMKWIQGNETEAQEMLSLVNDMLYLAQPESVDRTVTYSPVDLSKLAQSTVLQFESVAFEKGIVISDQIEPGIMVEGDSSRLTRLLSTLVDNACKYADDAGCVSVSLRHVGGGCELAVTNSGPVIDPADLPHLFDRFYRSDKARTRGKGGFGLGLSIAKAVAEEHGGTIEARSTAEAGTTFTATLPTIK